jgi:hypothetical protein
MKKQTMAMAAALIFSFAAECSPLPKEDSEEAEAVDAAHTFKLGKRIINGQEE